MKPERYALEAAPGFHETPARSADLRRQLRAGTIGGGPAGPATRVDHALAHRVTELGRLSRRAFLGGAGAVLSLPALEAVQPSRAHAQTATPLRFVPIYIPNGMMLGEVKPAGATGPLVLSPQLQAFAPLKEKMLVLSRMGTISTRPYKSGGDHVAGVAGWLSCRRPNQTTGADARNGITADQVIANHLAARHATRVSSMQLGVDAPQSAGSCDGLYACPHMHAISWTSTTQFLMPTPNAQVVFDQVFAGYDPNATAVEQAERLRKRKSVLDYMLGEANTLSARLGLADRARLQEYLTGIREVEKNVLAASPAAGCSPPARPAATSDPSKLVPLMNELIKLAFMCDATRVVSYKLGTSWLYPTLREMSFLGFSDQMHGISHYEEKALSRERFGQVEAWLWGQIADLCARLDSVAEAGGKTMLDNTAVLVFSDVNDGQRHEHYDRTVPIIGGLGGKLRTGRHIVYPPGQSVRTAPDGTVFASGFAHVYDTPVARLLLTIMNAMGVPDTTFGDDGTSPLDLS